MTKPVSKKENAKFWRDPDLDGLELLNATYVHFSYDRHVHGDRYALGVILAGAESFYYRGETKVAPTGSIVIIDPDEVHTGQAADRRGWTYRMLYPSLALMRRAAGIRSGTPHFPDSVIHDPELFAQIRSLHRASEQGASRLERESRLLSALALLSARHAAPRLEAGPVGRRRRAVGLARQYLEAHYAENVSLGDLARLTGLSAHHLLRVFRRELGLPPHAFQNQLRLCRAKQLLAGGSPIVEAALATGFSDQSHLTRRFKAAFGVTPGQYARHLNFIQD
jgi:AraC-like DNA-binding protein